MSSVKRNGRGLLVNFKSPTRGARTLIRLTSAQERRHLGLLPRTFAGDTGTTLVFIFAGHLEMDNKILCFLAGFLHVAVLSASDVSDLVDLVQVHIVFRHGDRAPLKQYSGDGFRGDLWPDGEGSLTRRGIEQQYALGRFFRQRYANFLTPGNISREVYIRSTDVDRVLQSALALASGFFPPEPKSFWNACENSTKNSSIVVNDSIMKENLCPLGNLWSPVPVHTVPLKDEFMLKQTATCPKLDRLNNELFSDAAVAYPKAKRDDLEKLLQRNANDAGWHDQQHLQGATVNPHLVKEDDNGKHFFERSINVYDSWDTLRRYEVALPKWADNKALGNLKEIALWLFNSYIGYDNDVARARLVGGHLLSKIFLAMKNNASVFPKKMYLYAGHDSTVGGLLSALQMREAQRKKSVEIPPVNAAVIVELFKNNTVRVLYKTTLAGSGMETLVHPKCENSTLCPLPKLSDIVEPYMVENWTAECLDQRTESTTSSISDISYPVGGIWAVIIILGLIVGVAMAVRWYKRRRAAQKGTVAADAARGTTDPTVSYRTLDNQMDSRGF
ncbi:putative Testicular acid phosphatase-like protein [Hypsibius exemplaris]|uniref:acid phosphatase n=1 Tax=Hypsibius exemplaris TaxID=2072580 RepID=A0A1W0WCL4_HYPEX|nr:putative Testicular acid phosphatase-like protein [Hypsibius exemplaris]